MSKHGPLWIVLGTTALFILFMILCPPKAPAGEIHGKVEAGYDWANNICFTDIHIEYHFFLWIDHIVYGGTKVLFDSDIIYNYPFKDIYNVGYQANLTKNLYLRFDILCSHAVLYQANEIPDKVLLYKYTFGNTRTISVGIRW